MLEQCCNHVKQCHNNIVMLCCAKNCRCELSRVKSPLFSPVCPLTRLLYLVVANKEFSRVGSIGKLLRMVLWLLFKVSHDSWGHVTWDDSPSRFYSAAQGCNIGLTWSSFQHCCPKNLLWHDRVFFLTYLKVTPLSRAATMKPGDIQ